MLSLAYNLQHLSGIFLAAKSALQLQAQGFGFAEINEGSRLQIVLPDEVSAGVVGSDSHKQEIKELIAAKTGKEVDIDVKCLEQGRRFEDSFVDIESMIHMDITIED